MYDINYFEDPVSEDDELGDLTDEQLQLFQLEESIDNYTKLRTLIEERYIVIWEQTIVPYLNYSEGIGILDKLGPGDGHKFFKFMLDNNRIYNEISDEILRLENLKKKKNTNDIPEQDRFEIFFMLTDKSDTKV